MVLQMEGTELRARPRSCLEHQVPVVHAVGTTDLSQRFIADGRRIGIMRCSLAGTVDRQYVWDDLS